jgi:hypothetical protein
MDEVVLAELASLEAKAEQLARRALDAVEEEFLMALRRPLALATDIVSGRRFLVFSEGDDQQHFLVEAADGSRVASFESWEAVLAWHDRTVVSPGFRMASPPPSPPEMIGAFAPASDSGHPV